MTFTQTKHAPIHWLRNPALAGGRLQFLNLKVNVCPVYCHEGVPEEPPVCVFFGPAQVPPGTRHREVRDALKIESQHLMNVARNHISHAVLPGELVQREVRTLERHADQPGRAVRKDKLHGLRRVRFQILL